MDTITHTLFGLSLYGAADKQEMTKQETKGAALHDGRREPNPGRRCYLAPVGHGRDVPMWHRGITHSIFLVPLFALLIYLVVRLLFRVNDFRYFKWRCSPCSSIIRPTCLMRGGRVISSRSHPSCDVRGHPDCRRRIWLILLVAWLIARKRQQGFVIYRYAWLAIVVHVAIQSAQGAYLYQQYKTDETEVALSASFIPTQFTVVTKQGRRCPSIKTPSIRTCADESSDECGRDRLDAPL